MEARSPLDSPKTPSATTAIVHPRERALLRKPNAHAIESLRHSNAAQIREHVDFAVVVCEFECSFPLPAKTKLKNEGNCLERMSLVLQGDVGFALDKQLAELQPAIHGGTMKRR